MAGHPLFDAGTAHARSFGAVTVVNAIATGRGAAIGIDLWTDAEVALAWADDETTVELTIEGDPDEDPRLARACVEKVLEHFGIDRPVRARVRTKSAIPISRGLKSSSSAANAMTLATVGALGLTVGDGPDDALSDLEVVRLGVDAALAAGVTITGAFDDASACYFGGLVATDNHDRAILHTEDPGDLEALIIVPHEKIRTIDTATAPTHPLRGMVEEAHALVLKGHWKEAMLRNSLAYGGSYGMSNRLVLSMLDTGAIAAGISGTGPAQAVIIRRDDWDCYTGIIATLAPRDRVLVAHVNKSKAFMQKRPLPPPPEIKVVQDGQLAPLEAGAK